MKVLLTGASGFLGRYVQKSLAAHGIDVVMTGRKPPPGVQNFFAADLLNEADIQSLVAAAGATHLLHLAWYVEHGKYWNSPLNLRWVESSVKLVEAFCKAGGQKVVMGGTCFEYARSDAPCIEDSTAIGPETFYGVCKDAARRLVMGTCALHQVPCAWGRIFFPFGAGEDPQRLIPSLIAVVRGERKPFGVNQGAHRDFIHASDVAEGFTALLQPRATGIYNVCTGAGTQIETVVREIARLLQADPAPILALATERPGDPGYVNGDNAKLKSLGWRPRLSITAGLERTLADMKSGAVS